MRASRALTACRPSRRDLGLLGLGIGALQEPQLVLLRAWRWRCSAWYLAATSACFSSFSRLAVQLAQDVFHPGEVLARVVPAVFRFTAALFVLGYPGGFFEEQAQLFGALFDDAADGALADDGVGRGPRPVPRNTSCTSRRRTGWLLM